MNEDYWQKRCVKAEMTLIQMQSMFSAQVILPMYEQMSKKVDDYFKEVAKPEAPVVTTASREEQ